MVQVIFEAPSPAVAAIQRETLIRRMSEHLVNAEVDMDDRDAALATLRTGTYPSGKPEMLLDEAIGAARGLKLPR